MIGFTLIPLIKRVIRIFSRRKDESSMKTWNVCLARSLVGRMMIAKGPFSPSCAILSANASLGFTPPPQDASTDPKGIKQSVSVEVVLEEVKGGVY